MFEKEAEEWCGKKNLTSSNVGYFTSAYCEQSYIAGAEFGYNKANEWHYVKDGDLPLLDTNVLVIHRWAKTPEVGKRIKAFIDSSVWVWAMCSDRFRYTSDDENVIAWKEIVLPALPKESE